MSQIDRPEHRRLPLAILAIVAMFGLCIVLLPRPPVQATVEEHPDGHPDAEVPGSHEAAIFSPIAGQFGTGDRAMQAIIDNITPHHYKVEMFLDRTGGTDDHPGDATAENFLKLSGEGVVGIFSHAFPGGLVVEAYATEEVRDNNFDSYLKGRQVPKRQPLFKEGEIVKCSFTTVGFGGSQGPEAFAICLTTLGIQNHFKDNDTIVHVVGCFSFALASAFNAREFFGYEGRLDVCPTTGPLSADAELLWGRMHGKIDDGAKRAAQLAFGGGGFSAQFSYKHKEGKLATVLSPAVKLHVPRKNENFAVPTTVDGRVVFDARMDTSVPAGQVIRVRDEGCLARIRQPEWDGDFVVKFALDLRLTGKARLIVNAKKAEGQRQGKKKQDLDGNNFGAGPDHVGPNGDDFEWEISCGQGT